MEATALRSKEEVKEDIEASRRRAKQTLRETKSALVEENPAVRAWKRTQSRARETKFAVIEKAHSADCAVRSRIYSWLGIAALLGLAVGFFSKRKSTKARCCE